MRACAQPSLSAGALRLHCCWKSSGILLNLNLMCCGSLSKLSRCIIFTSRVLSQAPGVDGTELSKIFTVSMLAPFVAVSPSWSSRCPPAVIRVLHGLSIFSGLNAHTICGLVTFSSFGACHFGANLQTSMPLVSLKPWNMLPNSFPTDFSQQACTCGSGWFSDSFGVSHFFNCSSQMQPALSALTMVAFRALTQSRCWILWALMWWWNGLRRRSC